jgi:hypothetical protein
MLFRNKTLLAKIESTYGTDPTPAGTDAILTSDLQIDPYAGPLVSRNNDRSTLGAELQLATNPQVQLTFGVEIAGSGTAGDAPAYSSILRACGFDETITGGVDVVYAPISTNFPSVTFYYFIDGQRHIVTGARGNVAVNLSRGQIPRFTFTFIGQYNTPTAASPSGVDISYFVSPLAVTEINTPTFTIGGSPLTDMVCEEFSFDMGNNVIARNIINKDEIFITDRNVTGQMVAEAVLPSTKDWFTDAVESDSGTNQQVLQLIHGTTGGNIVTFDAPGVQMTSISIADSDGLAVNGFGLSFIPVSGNDEVTITVA